MSEADALCLDRWRALAQACQAPARSFTTAISLRRPTPRALTWSLAQGAGGAATAGRLPDDPGQGGLRVDYDGVSQPALPRQLLAPGPQEAYRITGEAFAEVSAPNAGVRWIVGCAWAVFQSVLFGAAGGRQGFVIDVPAAQDCPSSGLGWKPVPGERPGEVVVWFDRPAVPGGFGAGSQPLSPESSHRADRDQTVLLAAAAVLAVASALFGGTSVENPLRLALVELSSLPVLVLGLRRLVSARLQPAVGGACG